jgi:hypothetical protein
VVHDRAAERRRAVALTRPRRSHKLRDDGSLTPAPAFCGMAGAASGGQRNSWVIFSAGVIQSRVCLGRRWLRLQARVAPVDWLLAARAAGEEADADDVYAGSTGDAVTDRWSAVLEMNLAGVIVGGATYLIGVVLPT